MNLPTATYRLQFRNSFDFASAIPVAHYLAKLGISHVYASPIFQARSGSTHGYDVTDHHRPDESLGGLSGFGRFSDELRSLGLGLILDIVPNHMAASTENPWWLDVLLRGRESAYAGFFDIDWSQDRLLLPILGKSFEEALEAGELVLGHERARPMLRYFDQAFPLGPASWSLIFPEPVAESAVSDHLARLSKDKRLIARVHDAQHYRLSHWRRARDELGYRRFFEISDLVGVRVEEEEVFDSVHSFIFELVETGRVQGLRVDHIDGLADPAKYLSDLQRKLPRQVPVWIEKILATDERLPAAWATAGATGYEFTAVACRLLTNDDGIDPLDAGYRSYSGLTETYGELVEEAKVEIFTRNLAAELNALVRFAAAALEGDVDQESLRAGIVALMSALPVYRTYFTEAAASGGDRNILSHAIALAKQGGKADPAMVDALAGLLTDGGDRAARFRNRFQQTSAALEAKAVEDTVFYRFNRLLSANEVGSDPARPSMTLREFHDRMTERAGLAPFALNATATHDTKRGEDARMRIAAISEAPDEWTAAVRHFDELLDAGRDRCDPNMRWLFYQSLLGAWTSPGDAGLGGRMSEFLLKAVRENKQHTSWVDRDAAYEAGLIEFVERALSHSEFKAAFDAASASFIGIGERKSLVQLGLKLFSPGIPDIYQGTEFADLSLVDPDNRRPVDFERRRAALNDKPGDLSSFDRRKLALLGYGLGIRRQWPDLFCGGYRQLLPPTGSSDRTIAFARENGTQRLVIAADLSGCADPPAWTIDAAEGRVVDTFPPAGDDAAFGIRVALVQRRAA